MYIIKKINKDEEITVKDEKELNIFCHEHKLDKSTLKRTHKDLCNNNGRYRRHHKNWFIYSFSEHKNKQKESKETYKKYELKNNIITAEQILELNSPEGLTEKDILKFFNLSEKEWKVTDYHITMYQASNKDSIQGKTNLYSVRTKFKKIEEGEVLDYEKIQESILEVINKLPQGNPPFELNNTDSNDTTLVVNIPDLHLNKYTSIDTQGVVYDSNIAVKRYFDSLNYILNEDKSKKCILVIGEDFFNIDNLDKTTTKGTPQSTHISYYDMYRLGYSILIHLISEMANKYTSVEVILIQGNHDTLSTFTLVVALEAYFRNFNNIYFDNSALPRKYRQIGNTAFGFGHMNNETKQTKHFLMPIEAPKLYGETKFRYVIQGHLHNLSVKEEGGIQHWTLPTLSNEGDWEISKGYMGSIKSAVGFVVTEDRGISKILVYNE